MGGNAQTKLEELSRTQLGLITRVQALEAGLTPKAIERRLASGDFALMRRRVYRLRGAPPETTQQRLLAVCLSLGPGTVASHRTAAWLWGLDRFPEPNVLEVTANFGKTVRLPGMRVHQRRNLAVEEYTERQGVPVTLLTRTLLDLTPLMTSDVLEIALDSAGRYRPEFRMQLNEFLSKLPRKGIDGSRRLFDLAMMRAGDEPTGSENETLVLQATRRAGIEAPFTQYPIFKTPDHPLCFPDFAWPRLKIALFVDSKYHLGKRAELDAVQRLELTKLGWKPIVVVKKMLRNRDWISSFAELFHPKFPEIVRSDS